MWYMTTRNGNLLIADKEINPKLVAYFKPNFDFISYPDKKEAEWSWALQSWGTKPIQKALPENQFSWREARSAKRLSIDEAINAKANYQPMATRTAKHVTQRRAEVAAGYLQIWLVAYGESYAHTYMSREQATNWRHPDANACTGAYAYQGGPVHIPMYGMSEEKIQNWIKCGAERVQFPEKDSVCIDNLWE